jgi:hypothetical protein
MHSIFVDWAGIAARPGLESRQGWNIFAFPHSVQIGSGAHLSSYKMDTERCFSGGKAAWANHSPLSSA